MYEPGDGDGLNAEVPDDDVPADRGQELVDQGPFLVGAKFFKKDDSEL